MKTWCLLALILIAVCLTSCSAASPVVADLEGSIALEARKQDESSRWKWGSWRFHIPSDHDSISITPSRNAERHFNVKILLEQSPCDTCIWISNFKNNGDGTISVSVTIRHPFYGHDYYTGFDVRGILLLPTHYKMGNPNYPQLSSPCIPSISMGDPELLNPDGFTDAFDPLADGMPPMLRYQPGGDLGGTYDADDREQYWTYGFPLWPFICYNSDEARNHFSSYAIVTRTYQIALPAGDWEFGYTVDACWAPPDNKPVTNVVTDFPKNAGTLHDYRIDASISKPLVGEELSIVKIRAYKHFPDLLEHTSAGHFSAGCLDGWITGHEVSIPSAITDEYLEYEFGLQNLLHRPPGEYPILLNTGIDLDDAQYFESIDPHWDYYSLPFGSHFSQILWVTVES
jgi:hypothetical protein